MAGTTPSGARLCLSAIKYTRTLSGLHGKEHLGRGNLSRSRDEAVHSGSLAIRQYSHTVVSSRSKSSGEAGLLRNPAAPES